MVYMKYLNVPKLKGKLLDMMGIYKELLLNEVMLILDGLVYKEMIKDDV